MKLVLRVLLVVFLATVLLTGFMSNWEFQRFSFPKGSINTTTSTDIGSEPLVIIIVKIIFSF